MHPIDFSLPDVGLREINGTVYVQDGFLVLHLRNALLGAVDVEKDLIKIEPQALEELYIRYGVFKDRLVIRPKQATLLDLVPGEHDLVIQLRVWRTARPDLEQLVGTFETLLREQQVDRPEASGQP
jgi:hypothetical protein